MYKYTNSSKFEKGYSKILNKRMSGKSCHLLTGIVLVGIGTKKEWFSHRVSRRTLPLRIATKKRVIFSISLMYSGEETSFSSSKNVWT